MHYIIFVNIYYFCGICSLGTGQSRPIGQWCWRERQWHVGIVENTAESNLGWYRTCCPRCWANQRVDWTAPLGTCNHVPSRVSVSLANARPPLNLHWDEVWEPHIHFLVFEAWFTIARSRLLGATNVYHMSLYVAHSQSKPVGSRAKTSFLVMKEFNAKSCYFFKINAF